MRSSARLRLRNSGPCFRLPADGTSIPAELSETTAGLSSDAATGCVWTVSTAYSAVAFGEFAVELQPALRGHGKLLACSLLFLLTFLNWLGLRTGSWLQEITSLTKALALILFVAACFVIVPTPGQSIAPPSSFLTMKGRLLIAIVIALQAVIVTYDGWYAAIYFAEEDEDPTKNLPQSSIGGVIACIAIFLLVNVSLFHVLGNRLAASQMPVADAAMAMFGGHGKQLILAVSLLTALSTINANFLATPRILFAMARDGMMPPWISSVNAGGTPTSALLLEAFVATALVLSGSFETLIAIAAILFVAVYLSGFTALFVLRIRQPELARPFKLWGYPWSNLGICLASVAFLVASVFADVKDALFTLIFIALTGPIYFLFVVKAGRFQDQNR
jgi:basic amino acid/polyamine antiporter, APA family